MLARYPLRPALRFRFVQSHARFDLRSSCNPATMRFHTATAPSVPFIEKGTMASRTVWHFAYGSNMNRAQMLARTGKILEEHNASLPNYQVRFNKKVRGGTAGANIQPMSGKTVHGVLYKIEEGSMRSLDRYEGVPDHYRRIEVQVTPEGGQPVPAQIYIAQKVEKWAAPVRSVFAGDAGRRGRTQPAGFLYWRN